MLLITVLCCVRATANFKGLLCEPTKCVYRCELQTTEVYVDAGWKWFKLPPGQAEMNW